MVFINYYVYRRRTEATYAAVNWRSETHSIFNNITFMAKGSTVHYGPMPNVNSGLTPKK